MKVEMVKNKQNLAISIFVSVSVNFLSGASAFIWVKKCILYTPINFSIPFNEIFANVQVYVATPTNTLNRS